MQKAGAVAQSHYVMDLYFPTAGKPRREALRMDAEDDETAVTEAKRIDLWRKPASFQVRSIKTTARSGDRLVYNSEAEAVSADGLLKAVAEAQTS